MCNLFNANHRKQRGRTAPNRALRDLWKKIKGFLWIDPRDHKPDHRKQRGRTAPNKKK